MADENHLLSKLQALLAAMDDAAFESLASKGLLRRAQKDLEKTKPEILPATAAGLPIKIDSFIVTLPETGPVKATCTCPSTSICQHILCACLFLKQFVAPPTSPTAGPAPDPTAQARQELRQFTPEALAQWASRPEWRAALTLLVSRPQCEIEEQGSVTIRLPLLNAECRYLPGAGLDGMIISGPGKDTRRLAVAAVLLFQQAQGMEPPIERPASGALTEAPGAPRSRQEILRATHELLCDAVSVGLSHLSSSIHQRFATLAVSALGVNLPRLSLALRSLADEVHLLLKRDALADEARLFLGMARGFALCEALAKAGDQPRPDLVGWHRTRYDDVGSLDLCGVGAYRWRTASGYEGLTILFWDERAKSWCSWSEARPRHQLAGFNPAQRYRQEGPWPGATSPAQLAHSRFKLMHARRSHALRLSGSQKTRALVTGPTPRLDFGEKAFTSWEGLPTHVIANTPVGLSDASPLSSFVVIRPAAWLDRHFDPVAQTYIWLLADYRGQILPLEVRFSDIHEPIIKFLESLEPQSTAPIGLLVKCQRSPNGLSVFPITLLKEQNECLQPVHMCFDNSVANAPAAPPTPATSPATEDSDEPLAEESEDDVTPASHTRLAELESRLIALAEGGMNHPSLKQALSDQAASLERAGLKLLASAASRFNEPETSGSLLLQLRYLCHMYQQMVEG